MQNNIKIFILTNFIKDFLIMIAKKSNIISQLRSPEYTI